MSKITYHLQTPLQVAPSCRVAELAFRTTLTVSDMRRLDRRPEGVAGGVALLSLLSGEPVDLIEALSVADFQTAETILTAVVDSHLARCRALVVDPARFMLWPSLNPALSLPDCLFQAGGTTGIVERLSLRFAPLIEQKGTPG